MCSRNCPLFRGTWVHLRFLWCSCFWICCFGTSIHELPMKISQLQHINRDNCVCTCIVCVCVRVESWETSIIMYSNTLNSENTTWPCWFPSSIYGFWLSLWYSLPFRNCCTYVCILICITVSCILVDSFDFWCKHHFQIYLSYIMPTSFSGGRRRSTRRESPTMGKQLVNFITCGCESSAPFFVIYKSRHEPTPYCW